MPSKKKKTPSDIRRKQRLRALWTSGISDAVAAIETLQNILPSAFPKDPRLVKPLIPAIGAQIAAIAGWNTDYANGVLWVWKRRAAYRAAVLRNTHYYDLDGHQTDALIDDAARERVRTLTLSTLSSNAVISRPQT